MNALLSMWHKTRVRATQFAGRFSQHREGLDRYRVPTLFFETKIRATFVSEMGSFSIQYIGRQLEDFSGQPIFKGASRGTGFLVTNTHWKIHTNM